MVEQTLNKPLSGEEIRKAILFDINKALELDDRFAKHHAYDQFAFKATLAIQFPSAVIENQNFTKEISAGETIPDGVVDVVQTERPIQPPNTARYETEQDIPVLVTDEKGFTVEKMVSYVGKDRSGRPKGVKSTPVSSSMTEKVKRNVVKGIDV